MALINWTRVFAGMTTPLMSYLDDNFNQINTAFGVATGVSQTPGANIVPIFGAQAGAPEASRVAAYDSAARLDTNSAAFSAYAGTSQTLTSGVSTKVQFNTEEFDTHSYFDNVTFYRFTPLKAGKYHLNAYVTGVSTGTLTSAVIALYKNSGLFKYGSAPIVGTSAYLSGTWLVDANGTTDYYEVFIALTGTGTLSTAVSGPSNDYFQGARVSI